MRRTRFTVGAAVVLAGLIYLFIAGFQQSRATHMTVSSLVERARTENLEGERIQLGGVVAGGSIQWDEFHHRARFAVTEGGALVPVEYVGNAVLPDTFKDRSPVVLEGYYRPDTGVFEAEMVMAKCPSKYEGQSYDGHIERVKEENR